MSHEIVCSKFNGSVTENMQAGCLRSQGIRMSGLFGGNATLWSDANLILQLAMGLALLIGMFLARKKMFRAHGICQSAVVILNLAAISFFMLPVFKRAVASKIPGSLGDSFYAV